VPNSSSRLLLMIAKFYQSLANWDQEDFYEYRPTHQSRYSLLELILLFVALQERHQSLIVRLPLLMRDHVNLSLVLVPPLPPLALMTVQTRACCYCAGANIGYCAGKRIADTGNATDSIVLSFENLIFLGVVLDIGMKSRVFYSGALSFK
jgi:hypothetical protein